MIPIGLYTGFICYLERDLKHEVTDLGIVASILSGVILSILLGFRNNAADSRWWEAQAVGPVGQRLAELRS